MNENGDLPAIRKYIEQVLRQFQSIGMSVGFPDLMRPSDSSASASFRQSSGDHQDYVTQLSAIHQMMNFMVQKRDEMVRTLQEYKKIIDGMAQWGVPIQVVRHYVQNFANRNARQIQDTYLHIQGPDYDQMRGLFLEISRSLQEVDGHYDGTPRSM